MREPDHYFAEFKTRFRAWSFNRKPSGKFFIFTRQMTVKAIECYNWLCNSREFNNYDELWEFMDNCREYLSINRDVLSAKDLRALTPVSWLNQWQEQIRLAKIYCDEKREKITRMAPDTAENP